MKNLGNKLNSLAWKARFKAIDLKERAKSALKNEDGDTNFLSIIIILAIVLVVAVIFIAFKDEIVGTLETEFKDFTSKVTGQDRGEVITGSK